MLPEPITEIIQDHFDSNIIDINSIQGGDINQGGKFTLDSGDTFFIKWNLSSDPSMFAKEAKGLAVLSDAESGLHIPEVITFGDHFMVLEWIHQGPKKDTSDYKFGQQLAFLHQNTADFFGLDHDNFIGRLPQSNSRHSTWADFFAIERIEPQIQMAVESGKIDRTLFRAVQKLYAKLGHIFPPEKPVLLHGDLWSGNYMFDMEGNPSVYDPAIYYGHREMDISMTRLFGGFSEEFYQGYEDTSPLEQGYEERIKLCNLYPILVHANLFGGSYARQAEQIIRHYA